MTINIFFGTYIDHNFFYGIFKLIFLIINPESTDNIQIIKFSILETTEFLALFGYSIYLEIIELKFCGLDKETKVEISKRASLDSTCGLLNEIDSNDLDYHLDDIDDDNKDD